MREVPVAAVRGECPRLRPDHRIALRRGARHRAGVGDGQTRQQKEPAARPPHGLTVRGSGTLQRSIRCPPGAMASTRQTIPPPRGRRRATPPESRPRARRVRSSCTGRSDCVWRPRRCTGCRRARRTSGAPGGVRSSVAEAGSGPSPASSAPRRTGVGLPGSAPRHEEQRQDGRRGERACAHEPARRARRASGRTSGGRVAASSCPALPSSRASRQSAEQSAQPRRG